MNESCVIQVTYYCEDQFREDEMCQAYRICRGADKSLARPNSLSTVFSVHGRVGSPTGPDPENRVGYQDVGSTGRPVSSGLQVPGEPFLSWSV
jgi:hypothetical protein